MVEMWVLWLLLVALVLGAVATWLLVVRIPRDEDDVSRDERRTEAAWISRTIEGGGGIAPESLVEEVLDLHEAYLQNPAAAPELTEAPPPAPGNPGSPQAPGNQVPAQAPGNAMPAAGQVPSPPGSPPPPGYPPPPPGYASPPPPPGYAPTLPPAADGAPPTDSTPPRR